jgi:hypothetical protein
MTAVKRRVDFYESEEGVAIQEELKLIAANVAYNTVASYSADSNLYPDNLIPFVDKHMRYLCNHPTIDPQQYLSNLRLITRKK